MASSRRGQPTRLPSDLSELFTSTAEPAPAPAAAPPRPPAKPRRGTPAKDVGHSYTAGGPSPDLRAAPPVRKTVYLRVDQVWELNKMVEDRQAKGQRVDASFLVRTAVDALLDGTAERSRARELASQGKRKR